MLKPEAHGFNLIADLGLTEHLHHPYLDGNKHPRVIGEGRVQLSNRFFSRFTGVLTGQGEDREKWKGEAIIKPVQRKVVDGLTAPSILSFIFHIPLHLWCVYIVIQGYMQYLVTSPLHRLLRKEKNYHII